MVAALDTGSSGSEKVAEFEGRRPRVESHTLPRMACSTAEHRLTTMWQLGMVVSAPSEMRTWAAACYNN